MYIAVEKVKNVPRYTLRTSCTINGRLTFKDLYDLGSDPGGFIKYAGHNAFYFDEAIEEALDKYSPDWDTDELEDLFWPWIRKDIRHAVETFKNRSSKKPSLTLKQKETIDLKIHSFDKRRAHFLKFGSMDQGPVEKMPAVLFKDLLNCSRDEIEQHFLRQESALKAHELKSYVYTVFDLQRFFHSFMAKKMPQAMDQEKADEYFIKELCRLNKQFFKISSTLHIYMIRYAVMFFDYIYADSTLLDDFVHSFMNRHRSHAPKPKNPVSANNALNIFQLTRNDLKTLTKRKLTRIYRKLARQVHPDTGGSDEKFVELNDAFNTLLEKIKA